MDGRAPRIVVAGGTGFIGSALVRAARARGWDVTLLRRADQDVPVTPPLLSPTLSPIANNADGSTPPFSEDVPGGFNSCANSPGQLLEFPWEPARGQLDPDVLRGARAVICLSGAGLADRMWTPARRRILRSSRVGPVELLAAGIVSLPASERPPVFLAGSAVGYYGSRGEAELPETAGPGTGFLADLCQEWEAAAAPAQSAGVCVTQLRTGLVLGRGGMLGKLVPLYWRHLGIRLGDGRQWQPYISLADHVRAQLWLVENPIPGPVNLSGPTPARAAAFHQELQRYAQKRSPLALPTALLRTDPTGMGPEALLTSQRAVPTALLAGGFTFRHPTLEDMLRTVLKPAG